MNKILLSLCAVTLGVATCAANAAFYFKGSVGNTLSSNHFEETIDAYTPAFSGRNLVGELVTSNVFAPGLAVGINNKFNNLWGMGLEFDVKKQFTDTKFRVPGGYSESAITSTGVGNYDYELENKYKLGLHAIVSLANSFYFKLGPSWLKQDLNLTITDSDSAASFKHSASQGVWGLTGGAGFIYKVSRNFGLYTEYNYTYFKEKSISGYAVGPASFPGSGGSDNHFNRRLQTSQSEFNLGFVWSTCLV